MSSRRSEQTGLTLCQSKLGGQRNCAPLPPESREGTPAAISLKQVLLVAHLCFCTPAACFPSKVSWGSRRRQLTCSTPEHAIRGKRICFLSNSIASSCGWQCLVKHQTQALKAKRDPTGCLEHRAFHVLSANNGSQVFSHHFHCPLILPRVAALALLTWSLVSARCVPKDRVFLLRACHCQEASGVGISHGLCLTLYQLGSSRVMGTRGSGGEAS